MFLWALSMSIAPIIGQNWGAGRFDRVDSALKTAYWFALGWGLLSFIVLFTAGPVVLTWISDDPEVVVAATAHLSILPIGMGLMGSSRLQHQLQRAWAPQSTIDDLGHSDALFVGTVCFDWQRMVWIHRYFVGFGGLDFVTAGLSFFWLRFSIKPEETLISSDARTAS